MTEIIAWLASLPHQSAVIVVLGSLAIVSYNVRSLFVSAARKLAQNAHERDELNRRFGDQARAIADLRARLENAENATDRHETILDVPGGPYRTARAARARVQVGVVDGCTCPCVGKCGGGFGLGNDDVTGCDCPCTGECCAWAPADPPPTKAKRERTDHLP